MISLESHSFEISIHRLDVYETSTSPLIDYYRGCELLVTIDGDRDPNVVYADVKEALDL